jgi:hypothetical protein
VLKRYVYKEIKFIDLKIEDSGQAKILTIYNDAENGIYFKIISWSEEKNHKEFDILVNARIKRIVIEYQGDGNE